MTPTLAELPRPHREAGGSTTHPYRLIDEQVDHPGRVTGQDRRHGDGGADHGERGREAGLALAGSADSPTVVAAAALALVVGAAVCRTAVAGAGGVIGPGHGNPPLNKG